MTQKGCINRLVLLTLGFVFILVALVLAYTGYQKQKNTTFPDSLASDFTRVKDLRVGDKLYLVRENGLAEDRIGSTVKHYGWQTVYNLKVGNTPSTYITEGFLVHNKGEVPASITINPDNVSNRADPDRYDVYFSGIPLTRDYGGPSNPHDCGTVGIGDTNNIKGQAVGCGEWETGSGTCRSMDSDNDIGANASGWFYNYNYASQNNGYLMYKAKSCGSGDDGTRDHWDCGTMSPGTVVSATGGQITPGSRITLTFTSTDAYTYVRLHHTTGEVVPGDGHDKLNSTDPAYLNNCTYSGSGGGPYTYSWTCTAPNTAGVHEATFSNRQNCEKKVTYTVARSYPVGGRVVDSVDSRALAGMSVEIVRDLGGGTSVSQIVTTNANGYFSAPQFVTEGDSYAVRPGNPPAIYFRYGKTTYGANQGSRTYENQASSGANLGCGTSCNFKFDPVEIKGKIVSDADHTTPVAEVSVVIANGSGDSMTVKTTGSGIFSTGPRFNLIQLEGSYAVRSATIPPSPFITPPKTTYSPAWWYTGAGQTLLGSSSYENQSSDIYNGKPGCLTNCNFEFAVASAPACTIDVNPPSGNTSTVFTFTGRASGGDGSYTYNWSNPQGSPSSGNLSTLSNVTYSSVGEKRPMLFVASAGKTGSCEKKVIISPYACTGTLPANAQVCPGDDQGLTANTAYAEVTACTAGTKCEYTVPADCTNTGTCICNYNPCTSDGSCLSPLVCWGGFCRNSVCPDSTTPGPDGNCVCPPPSPAICTGTLPANATLCTGDDQGLATDAPYTQVSACTTATKCEYTVPAPTCADTGTCICNYTPCADDSVCGAPDTCWGGFCRNSLCLDSTTPGVDGNCVCPPSPYVCTGTLPANAQLCTGDDQGLTADTPYTNPPTCTDATKCEYTLPPSDATYVLGRIWQDRNHNFVRDDTSEPLLTSSGANNFASVSVDVSCGSWNGAASYDAVNDCDSEGRGPYETGWISKSSVNGPCTITATLNSSGWYFTSSNGRRNWGDTALSGYGICWGSFGDVYTGSCLQGSVANNTCTKVRVVMNDWLDNIKNYSGFVNMWFAVDGVTPPPPPPPTYTCTGTLPANAQLCPGDDQGLTANTPYTQVSTCTAATKCEYTVPSLPPASSACQVVIGFGDLRGTNCKAVKVNSLGLIYDGGKVDCPN